MKRLRRRVTATDISNQIALSIEEESAVAEAVERAVANAVICKLLDPREIFLGAMRLDAHLKAMGTCQALEIRTLLAEQSWGAFERQYKRGGRSPYAPQAMLGLIL